MKPESSNLRNEKGRLTSPAQTSGAASHASVLASPLACEACMEVLHNLNNAFLGVLMNAQVLDCKLPSYSRSKRYIHEIERSAQRGNALVKRLLKHLTGECGVGKSSQASGLLTVPPVTEHVAVVASQGPTATEQNVIDRTQCSVANAAPVFEDRYADAHKGM
jgi:hypothetical protein